MKTGLIAQPGLMYNTSMGTNWTHSPEARKRISKAKKKLYAGHVKLVACEFCSSSFRTTIARIKNGRGRFCSKSCFYKSIKGVRRSPETEFVSESTSGNKNVNWKGDNAGMNALHDWVKRKLGNPGKCEECGLESDSPYKIHWANKSGKYLRELSDWIRLCAVCHRRYDMKNEMLGLRKNIEKSRGK